MKKSIIIATRQSPLALWQARYVQAQLQAYCPQLKVELLPLVTQGDKILNRTLADIGGKNLFLKELQQAVLEKRADIAVHSIKDMSVMATLGLTLAAICERGDARDALLSHVGKQLMDLPLGATVGTASVRRKAQLLTLRPDLQIKNLRGNLQTRLQKFSDKQYDAIVLAAAGLQRLEKNSLITSYFDVQTFIPAIGQGAIGIECRDDDDVLKACLVNLNHQPTRQCITVERKFGEALQVDCGAPVAAYAQWLDDKIKLIAMVARSDGSESIRGEAVLDVTENIGQQVANDLLVRGADKLLADERHKY